ncbi:MAG: mechanosensitive ion channel family protein, partial [Pseudomonadota bacterium]
LAASGQGWMLWLALAGGVFLALRFIRAILSGLTAHKQQPDHTLRNIAASLTTKTHTLFLIAASLELTAPFVMKLEEGHATLLHRSFMVLTILQIVFWLRVALFAALERYMAGDHTDRRSAESIRSLSRFTINILLFAIAGITTINNLGYDATGLLAGLGIGGIAIGLAAQTIFQDLFAGVSIMLDRPFVRGDFISFNGFSGTIDRIGLKTTRLKSLSGEQLVVSNANLLNNEIQNYKVMRERRATFTLGVTYQTPHAVLASIPKDIEDIITKESGCRFDRCHLSAYGGSAIEFQTVYYILSADYETFMDHQQSIYLAVHKLFEDAGIEFAYPTQTIFLAKE